MQATKKRTISPDSPRKKIKDKRRVQLIEANMESIAVRGLTETTITHISETAGMSRGIINFYFDSKETMMRETLTHLLEEQTLAWQEALEKASGSSPEKLQAIVKALFSSRVCARKKLAVWAAFIAHAATHAPYRFAFEQANRQLAEAIHPLVDSSQSEALTAQLLGIMRGFWLEQLVGDKSLDKATMEALCLRIVQPAREKEQVRANAYTPPLARTDTSNPLLKESRKPKAMTSGKKAPKSTHVEESPVVADLFASLKSAS